MTGFWKPRFGSLGNFKWKSRFFRKNLMLILLIASIPGLIIGSSTYWITTSSLEKKLQRQHLEQIGQWAVNIDDQLNYLEMTMSHWAFDPKFDQSLKTMNIAYHFEQVQDLYRTLLMLEGTHPFLEKVELVLDVKQPVHFSKERFTYIEDAGEMEAYRVLLNHEKSALWTTQYPYGSSDNLALVNKIPGGSIDQFGLLVATVNKNKLIQSLKTLTPYEEGETLLLNKDGSWELSTNGRPFAGLENALKEEYGKRGSNPGSFLFEYDGASYSVSCGQFNRLGFTWVYISAAPLTSVIAPVITVSKWILYISLSGFVMALLMSWFVSWSIYSPVERLVNLLTGGKGSTGHDEFGLFEEEWKHLANERASMSSKLKDQLPVLREGFFLQLAQGYLFSLRENELHERLDYYGWKTDGVLHVALMFRLTGFSGLEGRFSAGDEELVTFAAANIIGELAGKRYEQAEVINFHNFSIGLLLALPLHHPVKRLNEDVELFCNELLQTINHIIRMKATIAISRPCASVKQIPHIFEEVKQAMSYRVLLEDNQMIWTEELAKSNHMFDSSYPFALDKDIVSAIRSGQEEEAGELIVQFMDELSANGSTEFYIQQGMLQLLGSIRYAAMQSGMNPIQLFGKADLFHELGKIKERQEMLAWFRHRVVKLLVREMGSRQDNHVKQMVEKAASYLHEQYMTGVSLESCADLLGTSPYTLSRAFKQILGTTFIDYLTNIRIEQAKLLLLDPDLQISEAAEKVGYQHSYFNRLFKKYEGITPSQYREQNRPENRR